MSAVERAAPPVPPEPPEVEPLLEEALPELVVVAELDPDVVAVERIESAEAEMVDALFASALLQYCSPKLITLAASAAEQDWSEQSRMPYPKSWFVQ